MVYSDTDFGPIISGEEMDYEEYNPEYKERNSHIISSINYTLDNYEDQIDAIDRSVYQNMSKESYLINKNKFFYDEGPIAKKDPHSR